MSKNGKFLIDMKVWSDLSASTNDPFQRDFSWLEQLTGVILTQSFNSSYLIAASPGSQTVTLPMTTGKYVFIKSDQPLAVRYNGETQQLNTVNPATPGTTFDGVLFQKIDVTSLVLDNLGTAIANVLVWVGS